MRLHHHHSPEPVLLRMRKEHEESNDHLPDHDDIHTLIDRMNKNTIEINREFALLYDPKNNVATTVDHDEMQTSDSIKELKLHRLYMKARKKRQTLYG